MKTKAALDAMVGDVHHDQPKHVPLRESAVRRFIDAVLALSDDPGPANLERYLEASRELEESRRSRQTPRRAGRRTGGSNAVVRRGRGTVETATGDVP